MVAMSASISRLCQMVHDTGLGPGTEDRLQVMLEAARERGRLNDKFTVVKKLVDDLNICLQPTQVGSAMPATLNGLYGDNLFEALVDLRLPAIAPENVHLEVALAAQRLPQQDTIDIITHVYAQIIHKDYYVPEEDDRSLAFLTRRASLDGVVQKHVELATNAAAPHTSVGDPTH